MKSQIPNNATAFLLKFVKPEYENDFIQGKLRMNPLSYFIKREKETGDRGVGDALEASAVYADVELTLMDPETDEVLVKGKAERVNLHSNDRIKSPVLCMYSVDKDVLQVDSEDESTIGTFPRIEKDDLDKLISDFGDNMLIINAKLFMDRVKEKCEELQIDFKAGKVKYHDFSTNYSDRVSKYLDLDSSEICFIKDDYFKAQNEYRLLLENVSTESFYILEIGDISDLVTKFKISDFFSGRYKIILKKEMISI
ncbi:hypothetical protein M5J14_23260 [Lysinibacillus sp. OL1_EC]|uniref:hypothetical protein n=1 Tax=unclassified Lysinibacillus TaxID=2636778 RepID=UPI001039E995|nr:MULTISPECIES: hypothetical protein [unclassified Lysinibacillus]MCM0627403.1 hypothetical protein [Lysinibacillus sp. OL1_EC]TBV84863.1 hypothetical protein EW028_23870 [Lysinibacillus sp. OL1]